MKARNVTECPYYEVAKRHASLLEHLVRDEMRKRGGMTHDDFVKLNERLAAFLCNAWETGLCEGYDSKRRKRS